MPLKTGTYDVASLLANRAQTVEQFGEDEFAQIAQAELEAHNRLVNEMLNEIAEPTTDRQRRTGNDSRGELIAVDEYGRGVTQKSAGGYNIGFPMRAYQYNLGWTRKYFQQQTVADATQRMVDAQTAHRVGMLRELKRAAYLSANYTFTDRLVAPQLDLPVKRFVNADSATIRNGPNAEVFDGSTHTHYLANASLTAAALLSLVNTIVEHGVNDGEQVRIVISQTDRTAVEALAGFKAYPDPRINYVATDQNRTTIALNQLTNLAIGTFGAAEVWVKPWAIANYAFGYVSNAAVRPLVLRTRAGNAGLAIAAEIDTYPLRAQYMETEFGLGAWNRTAAGVLYFAGGTYTDPTIS